MVCREYGLSSAVIGQVRTTSWLDDAQIQSVYHTALHDPLLFGGDSASTWSREQLIDAVTSWARRDATFNPVYLPQRRAGLQRRIEEGYSPAVAGMPTERLSALARLRTAVTASEQATRARLQLIAGARGMSEREVAREFHELRAEAPSGRQPRATDEQRADFGLIPLDPATRYAITELAARPPMRTPVPRVDRWIPVTPGGQNPIVEVGVSDSDDRIELRRADGTLEVRTRRDRHPDVHRLTQRQAAAYLAYPEPEAGDLQPWRLRCDDCGRFVPRSGHQCLQGARAHGVLSRFVSQGTHLQMPNPSSLLSTAQEHPNEVVRAHVEGAGSQGGVVTGDVRIHINGSAITADGGSYRVDIDDHGDDLTCQECGSVACEHVQQARLIIRRELRIAGRTPSSADVDAALPAPTAWLTVTDRPTPTATPPTVSATFNFRDSPQAFREAARSGHNDGVAMLPAGSFDRGYTRGVTFGIELEYGGGNSTGGVGDALHGAGLIDSPIMDGYHRGGARVDRRQQHWRLEADATVTGELITPVLTDTTEAWEQLAVACTALRENGATTDGAGSHTNIGGIEWTPGDLWRLAHLFRAHEDDLMRLGRTRGSARDWTRWTPPVRPVAEQEWTHPREAAVGRGMLNLTHAFMPPASRRVEFRFPDASLDPGVIQAQTRLCAAMTGYAASNTAQVPIGQHTPTGMTRREGSHMTMRLSGEEFASLTEPIRGLIDDLFTTDEERLQIAQLWGHGAYR